MVLLQGLESSSLDIIRTKIGGTPRQASRQVSESHDAKGPFQDLDHNAAEKIQEGSRHTG